MGIDHSRDPTGAPPAATGVKKVAKAAAAPGEESDLIRVRISKDRLYILLDCDTEGKDLDDVAAVVFVKLAAFGVASPPGKDELRSWLRKTADATPMIRNAVVLSGKPVTPPVDSRIEWGGDFFNPGFEIDESTGRVNFRRHLAQRNVSERQLLATVVPPVMGISGLDVLGNLLRPRKPRPCRIRAGENVYQEEGTASFFASVSGRIRWQADMLSVDHLYEIQGDIGLETGDISHDGAVLVQGDVLKGCRVEAVGDVEVMGAVEGAHIQAGGMLRVHGGIAGAVGVRIIVAGGLQARYILDADIQSNGDVSVESEIMHTKITTRGSVYVPTGRIVGGSVSALGGIDVGQVGSPASVPTALVAGEDHGLEGKLQILKKKLQLNEENVAKIHSTLAPLKGKIATLPATSRDAIRTLLEKLPGMGASIERLKEEIEEAREESEARAQPLILIRNRVHAESRLTIDGETLHVREEGAGPVKPLIVDGHIRLVPTNLKSITRQVAPDLDTDTPHEAHESLH